MPEELEQEIAGRRLAEEALQRANNELEVRIQERTTELAQANTALQESEERSRHLLAFHQAVMANMAEGLYTVDVQGFPTYVNPAAESYFGWTTAELQGRRLHDVAHYKHPDGTPFPIEECAGYQVQRQGNPLREFEDMFIRKDGTFFPVILSAAPLLSGGKIIGRVVVFRDVTDRQRADESLRKSDESLRLALGIARMGTWDWDLLTNQVVWSPGMQEIYGYTPGTFGGTLEAAVERTHPEDRDMVNRAVANLAAGINEPNLEYRVVWPGGSTHWIQGCGQAFKDEAGKPVRFIGVCMDITPRKEAEKTQRQLEAQLQQAKKLESLGVLAGGVAHDFNNLLTSILGNAGLALMELPRDSPVRESIKNIESASLRAADLCKQMLAYAGKGHLVTQVLDLNRMVEETGNLLQTVISKKAILRYDLKPNLPPIEADATQVRQVIMNLITNASDAVGAESGVISIGTGTVEADGAYLRAAYLDDNLAEGRYIFFEVADTGCGMDAATLARIFDPFFTTKFPGRGLGLAAVMGIIRSHKGGIRVHSEPGRGSTFNVLLPVARSSPPDGNATPAAEREWQGQGTVLVIDDEEPVRAVARKMLEMAGFAVLTAEDGHKGLEMFQAAADQVRVVLLDMTMPHLNGEATLQALQRLRPNIPVILCSGYDEQETTRQFVGKGLAGFLQKPFHPRQLTAKIREVLEGGQR